MRPTTTAIAATALCAALFAPLTACDAGNEPIPFGTNPTSTTRGDATTGADGSTSTGTLMSDAIIASPADLALYDDFQVIDGDLVVTTTDPAGVRLPRLLRVTGDIVVVGTAAREVSGNLDLPELEEIGGNVVLDYTQTVAVLNIPRVETIGGHVELAHGIFEVQALRLARINGDLRVHDASIAGMNVANLEEIGGSIAMTRYSTEGAPAILQLEPHRLRTIGGSISVSRGVRFRLFAPALVSVAGAIDASFIELSLEAAALETIGGHVRLSSVAVYSLDLVRLRAIGGDLVVEDASGPALVTLALPALAEVSGGVAISRVANLQNLPLNALTSLGGALRVVDNPALRTLAVNALPAAPGAVVVNGNGTISASLSALETIAGPLTIGDNDGLSLTLAKLTTIGGDLGVFRQRVGGFTAHALSTVGGSVDLHGLVFETTGPAIPLLETVGGDLVARDNDFLQDLELPLLTTVGTVDEAGGVVVGDLAVERNPDLTSVLWPNLERVAVGIRVRANPALPTAVVDAALDGVAHGGDAVVCGNLGGEPCP